MSDYSAVPTILDIHGNRTINGIPVLYESDVIIATKIAELEKAIEGLYDLIEELAKKI